MNLTGIKIRIGLNIDMMDIAIFQCGKVMQNAFEVCREVFFIVLSKPNRYAVRFFYNGKLLILVKARLYHVLIGFILLHDK